jgi:ubiquinone/menaquinone biosynthesis C-methylase UbiE
MDELYSLENAQKFNWSSVSGNLNPERVSHLETYLVGEKILDAGCGGGAYVEFLSRKGLDVTGIDKHEQFLELAREQGRMGNYVQGDLTNLPFPDNTFDCTYCFDVLEHIDDKLAVQELVRVTKKRLIITVPKEDEVMQKYNLTFLHYQDKTHLRNYTSASLNSLLSAHSVSNLTIFPELAIPIKNIVAEMSNFDLEEIANTVATYITTNVRSIKLINYLKKSSLSNFIAQEILKTFSQNLFNEESYEKIYTGLVAIADLET